MNAKKFSDAMSELDTKYVDEALNYKTKMKKPIWIKWGIMAACLCLIICVVTIPRLLNGSNPPISGDLAPMVYVNNKLYQYTDSQLDFTDKESQFTYLGEIESKVSSSQEPKENFQANDFAQCHTVRQRQITGRGNHTVSTYNNRSVMKRSIFFKYIN